MARKIKIPKNKKFCFWSYDTFPYCIGAEVESLDDMGRVSAKGFGGSLFRPFLFTNLANGRALNDKLNELTEQRRKTYEVIERGFDAELSTLIELPS